MKAIQLLGVALAATVSTPLTQDDHRPVWSTVGLELPCADVEQTAAFYAGVFGYELVQEVEQGGLLRHGEAYLILDGTRQAPPRSAGEPASRVYINHRVADLAACADEIVRHGGELVDDEPRRFVLGTSLTFEDPSGNRGNVVVLDQETATADQLPQLFNLSVRASGLAKLETFFCEELGFEVLTRSYLPKTLPLVKRGGVSLVLHEADTTRAGEPSACGAAIVLMADEPPAEKPGDDRRASPVYGSALCLVGPEAIEVRAISRDAFEAALAEDG